MVRRGEEVALRGYKELGRYREVHGIVDAIPHIETSESAELNIVLEVTGVEYAYPDM